MDRTLSYSNGEAPRGGVGLATFESTHSETRSISSFDCCCFLRAIPCGSISAKVHFPTYWFPFVSLQCNCLSWSIYHSDVRWWEGNFPVLLESQMNLIIKYEGKTLAPLVTGLYSMKPVTALCRCIFFQLCSLFVALLQRGIDHISPSNRTTLSVTIYSDLHLLVYCALLLFLWL